MARLQTLSYIDFQHDALTVADDISQGIVTQEDVWVSCYKAGETSVHGKMKFTKGEESDGPQGVRIQPREGVKVTRKNHTTFIVECPSLKMKPTILRFPRQTLTPPSNKAAISAPLNINALSISPSTAHIAYGGPDGYLKVQSTTDTSESEITSSIGVEKQEVVNLKGHVGDILCTRFFPSGKVLLSSSADSTIRIHSIETGSNPRTLTGHKRAVASLHILGVGKNVLSGSKDGSVKLWNVGEGKCLTSLYVDGYKGVECMVVGIGAEAIKTGKRKVQEEKGEEQETFESTMLDGEIESDTSDQVIFIGTSSGTISIFDLSSKTTIHSSIPHLPPASSLHSSFPTDLIGGSIHSIAYSPTHHLLATGSSKGVIVIRDTRTLSSQPDKILHAFRRTDSAINDLVFVEDSAGGSGNGVPGGVELIIAPDSGLPCKLRIPLIVDQDGEREHTANGVEVVEEYAGWEAVPVESISLGSNVIWLGGAEAGLRRY